MVLCWRRHGRAGGCQKYGGVAQLGEHLPCKQGVVGSNPVISTKAFLKADGWIVGRRRCELIRKRLRAEGHLKNSGEQKAEDFERRIHCLEELP